MIGRFREILLYIIYLLSLYVLFLYFKHTLKVVRDTSDKILLSSANTEPQALMCRLYLLTCGQWLDHLAHPPRPTPASASRGPICHSLHPAEWRFTKSQQTRWPPVHIYNPLAAARDINNNNKWMDMCQVCPFLWGYISWLSWVKLNRRQLVFLIPLLLA